MQIHKLTNSFNNAIEGLIHAFRTQRNMKIHFTIAFLVMLASLFTDVSSRELILLFFAISFVIAMELINTSIEIVIDLVSQEYRLQARIAKNIAAAAVLMASINAIVLGYFIFLDEIRSLGLNIIDNIRQDPSHVIFINLGLLVIIIITIKAKQGKGTPLQGGMPSGHSAISFAITTIIMFLSMDILITVLVLVMALIVVQSRLESATHNLLEVFTGALIGILLTVILFSLI